jgi:hypothetical protein
MWQLVRVVRLSWPSAGLTGMEFPPRPADTSLHSLHNTNTHSFNDSVSIPNIITVIVKYPLASTVMITLNCPIYKNGYYTVCPLNRIRDRWTPSKCFVCRVFYTILHVRVLLLIQNVTQCSRQTRDGEDQVGSKDGRFLLFASAIFFIVNLIFNASWSCGCLLYIIWRCCTNWRVYVISGGAEVF